MNSEKTIAEKYISALEHRGSPGKSREIAPYVQDPYDMSPEQYSQAKKRIKAEYRERNRATQKKLTSQAWASIRRKPQKWLDYREKKNRELADLETKYKRSKIDREYGNIPGDWREDERGKYPRGTQGKPKRRRQLPPSSTPTPPRREIPSPHYDAEAEWEPVPEPRGLPPGRPRPTSGGRPAVAGPPPRRGLPPGRPSSPPRRSLPPSKPEPRDVTPGSGRGLPPRRNPAGYLPPAEKDRTRKAVDRIKKRRGSRR